MSSNLPINWADKKNSPVLADFIAKYGAEYCMTAEEINQMRDAVNEMAVIQQSIFLGAAEPTFTPTGTGRAYWIATKPGTYTNHGNVIVGANEIAFIVRDAVGGFSISKTGLDFTEYPIKSDLFKYEIGKNKFDKSKAITGFYISNTSGYLESNGPSIVTDWIPIDTTKTYYVSGRTTSGMRFRNASGALLKPLNSSGGVAINWDLGEVNGIVLPPLEATDVQFTTTLTGDGSIDNVQFEDGVLPSAYEPYTSTQILKTELIPELNSKVSLNDLTERVNLFDKTTVVEGKYVSTNSGYLDADATSAVSAVIPVEANEIYYLQGKTVGNREVVFYNILGTKLKPYTVAGVESLNFTTPNNNGAFKAPPTAVSMQFTVKFVGTGIYDLIMVSKGAYAKDYVEYDKIVIKESLLPAVNSDASVTVSTFKVLRESNSFKIRTSFDNSYDVLVRLNNGSYLNRLYNVEQAKLLLKNEADTDIGIALNGTGGDDSAPVFFNGTIVGGNHGCPIFRTTANAHGKTLADVGAKYIASNGSEVTIIEIIDLNTFILGLKNISASTGWSFLHPVGNLTYLSNGTSTSAVTVTNYAYDQLYPSVKNVAHKLVVDGNEKTNYGTFYGDKINIIETYDIVDYPDMIAKLIANRPIAGYLSQPLFTNGDTIISITNVFNVQAKGTITLVCSIEVLKDIVFDYYGLTQNGFVNPSWATTVRRYFPKTLPIINNGTTFDFRLKPEFKTPIITDVLNITAEYWEDSKPVNRVVDLLQSSDLKINFNLGYLPLGGNRIDLINKAWYMISSKKLYPRYIDEKIGVANVLVAGTVKQGIAFRGWSKPNGIRTNEFLVENGGKHYLYLDYHTVGIDTMELPSYLLGKSVTVIDKSANVELITSIVTGSVKVKIMTSTPMYGYCELLLE